ncbi:MAG TPA: MarR family transcriptional regulator [Candidatus Tidjanibacter faecipullorum]|mgnify:CR=1 FL=1|uniref:MarR family transcriptional regulator n=1 Tax=Candidatus Tidjanibacter faecipullorum TaxID=2838766 RepID=A0A9D2ILD2_9BACT|nr:MarR family transcriptional regulator [Candidatus Tidjanibacter faecipullorum]
MEEQILKALAEPKKAAEVAEATGIDKKEVDKIIKKLVKEGKVESPKRCYYAVKR